MSTFSSRALPRVASVRSARYTYGSLVAFGLLILALSVFLWSPAMPSAAHPLPRNASSAAAPGAVITNGWTNVFPRLGGVSAVSTTDVWAAGEQAHVIHYSNGAWTSVDPPIMRGMYLGDIKMISATNGWIAAGNHAFQYDGETWIERSAGLDAAGAYLNKLAVTPTGDVWATLQSNSPVGYLAHWNGLQWNIVLAQADFLFSDIAMISASDGWAVGYARDSGFPALLMHYDGAIWTRIPPPADPTLSEFNLVAAGSTGDAWVIGNPFNNTARAVYRYNNGAWTSWLLPHDTSPRDLFMLNSTEGWVAAGSSLYHWDGTNWTVEYTGRDITGVSGVSGSVWGVGAGDGVFHRSENGIWTQEWGGPTSQDLNSVSALGTAGAWAVGNAGTILHYSGGIWQSQVSGTTSDLFHVQTLPSGDAYAVGDRTILHWDGRTWTQVATPTVTMYGIYMLNNSEGWAVGALGTILHYTGGTWTAVSSPVTGNLYAVAMDSAGHGWAAGGYGAGGTLLEYAGGHWTALVESGPGMPIFRDIVLGPAAGEVWIAGGSGGNYNNKILHFKDGIWSEVLRTNDTLSGIALGGAGTVWAVGYNAYYYSGSAWTTVALPITFSTVQAVTIIPGQGGWAVGPLGTILRYDGTWTPPIPPTATATSTATATRTPTATATADTSATSTATSSATATATATSSATNTATNTATATATNSPTDTPTSTPTGTPTNTPTGTPPATETSTPVATATPAYTATGTPTRTPARVPTATHTSTAVATATTAPPSATPVPPTATPTAVPATSTPCALSFSDVFSTDYFYEPVRYLACRGVISGYSDGTFRPGNNTTRGQMVKIVVLGLGVPAYTPPTGATFADVPPAHPFFSVIEAAAHAGVVGGYTCGGAANEPCDAQQRPYFRPGADVTRGQLAKIVTIAAGWPAGNPAQATFADVPPGSPFFGFVEAASCRGIISGYTCGTAPGEPCDPTGRPYFRPSNHATRGQIAKIVYGALTRPDACAAP